MSATDDLGAFTNALLDEARRAGLTIVTAESCTAGLMCQMLSDAEGAAEHFHGGFVTYTKEQKSRALGVPWSVLREQGAVCGTVARAMADGALRHSGADIAASITGVAGPAPDEDGNPVGRVCIAVARRGETARDVERQYGDIGRDAIRERAVADAITAMRGLIGEKAVAA